MSREEEAGGACLQREWPWKEHRSTAMPPTGWHGPDSSQGMQAGSSSSGMQGEPTAAGWPRPPTHPRSTATCAGSALSRNAMCGWSPAPSAKLNRVAISLEVWTVPVEKRCRTQAVPSYLASQPTSDWLTYATQGWPVEARASEVECAMPGDSGAEPTRDQVPQT